MDVQPYPESEFDVALTTQTVNSESAVAFFPDTSAFAIGRGSFTSNVTNNVYMLQEQSSEFQRIRLGYTGSFFPNATGFAISGGTFTCNVTNNVYNEEFSEFPRIPLGNIKLVGDELIHSGTLGRQNREVVVRRMYSAKICPDPALVTVAIYQGHAAEEEWREHLAKYEAIR
ncbi:hypothetical protein C8R45DRAFT_1022489 [Mycena sanguinolenta]|nr:hypothetical protein C8R45DRAFT_1022489 [Mycena sanguinolenta]